MKGDVMRKGLIRGMLVAGLLLISQQAFSASNWVAAWGTSQQLMKPDRVIPWRRPRPPGSRNRPCA